jgi:putative heme-binding domain-containing protein
MSRRLLLSACLLSLFPGPLLGAETALPAVPDGFTVELVAGPEHVQHPMMACFDDQGRLYVCDSAGTNRPAAELVADPQDSIKVLEDTDGDGKFDKSWTFADKMVFPQGCLWYRGSLYTCSSPYLWKLTDTDGDGVCDERTILVKSFGFSGNAADIHGPFLSPDGRLYWCDGRHGHEIHDRDVGDGESRIGGDDDVAASPADPEPGLPNPDDGELLTKGKAARIFSCRPDGSDLRVLCGGGMDNPVEVDFWETGECLGTVNLFFGQPRGDCLVHWVEGGVYPREDMQDCIAEFPWTGGLLGPVHNYGHVAVSGMCRYRSSEFGDLTGAQDRLAASRRDADAGGDRELPRPAGSGLNDRAAFFVTQFNTHKVVQTILERDGATFRHVDTRDFLVSADPDFHPTDVLEDADGSLLVVNTGGWFRIGCPTSQIAKPEIAGGIYRVRNIDPADSDGRVPPRWTRTQPLATPRDARRELETIARRDDLGTLQTLDTSFLVQMAGQALSAHGDDHIVEHLATVALTRVADRRSTGWLLEDSDPRTRRAALIALDQMAGGNLAQDEVLPLLATSDARLQAAVLDVISRREGWSAGAMELFATWMGEELTDERAGIMRRFLAARAGEDAVQEFMTASLRTAGMNPAARGVLMEALASAEITEWPVEWTDVLRGALANDDVEQRLGALRIIGSRRLTDLDAEVQALFVDDDQPTAVRVEALAVVGPRLAELTMTDRDFVSRTLRGDEADLLLKLRLTSAYTAAPLSEVHVCTATGLTTTLGPTFVPALWPAYQQAASVTRQKHVVQVLSNLEELPNIPEQQLHDLLETYTEEARATAGPLLERFAQRDAERVARLESLLPLTEGGQADRGRYLFFGQTASCSKCHRVGEEGGLVGPDLTKIAAIRQPRDLLESIVYPSASLARDYGSFTVITTDGRTHNGLMAGQSTDTITLRFADLSELRIPRGEVEIITPSEVSIMPQGLETKLDPEALRDLLAYLQTLK